MSETIDTYTEAVNDYTPIQAWQLRILGISASVASLVFGLVAIYLYVCMKNRNFRHHLILLLLLSDYLKALVLLWFPARLETTVSARDNQNFCAIVGFFTATSIELSDLAVLSLAVHFALLVFKRSPEQGVEGGLYPYRKIVYVINIVLPLVLASLAFVKRGAQSYMPYVTWCYLPVRPVWYRIVLSWGLRYAIIILILVLYISIYVHVKLEYRSVVKHLGHSQTFLDEKDFDITTFRGKLKRYWKKFTSVITYLPGFALMERELPLGFHLHHHNSSSGQRRRSQNPGQTIEQNHQNDEQPNEMTADAAARLRQDSQVEAIAQFQRETLYRFQQRRSMIERSIKSIFIYPAAYIFLWIAPFALQCLQFNYEFKHGTIFWINAIAAFMQPFNCVVDTVAFCIREKPWRYHEERVFTTKYIRRWWYNKKHVDKPSTENDTESQQQQSQDGDECDVSQKSGGYSIKKQSPQIQQYGIASPVSPHTTTGGIDHLDPFGSTTARRVDIEPGFVNDDDDGQSMDLMEFLR